MYAKLFSSLYQGTLRGRSDEILVFTNLLAHTSKDGTVDKHFRAIAEETGLTIEAVKAAIENLEAPDEESRSPEEGGARIVRLDEHRVWGWRVVNHAKYRAIRSEEDRAEQNRLAQKRWRERNKPSVSNHKPSKPIQRQYAESEANTSSIPISAVPACVDLALMVEESSKPSSKPRETDPVKLRLFALFNRRQSRLMDPKEEAAFRKAKIEEEDLASVESWWNDDHREWNGENYRPRTLITLLNGWSATVDKADDWKAFPPPPPAMKLPFQK